MIRVEASFLGRGKGLPLVLGSHILMLLLACILNLLMNLNLLKLFGLGLLRVNLLSGWGVTFLLIDLRWLSLVMLRLGLRLLGLNFLRTILLRQLHGRLCNGLQLFVLHYGLLRVRSTLLRWGLPLKVNLSSLSRMDLLDNFPLTVLLVHDYFLGLVRGGSTLILGHYQLVALNYVGLRLGIDGLSLGNGDLHIWRYYLPFWLDLSSGDLDLMNSVILWLMLGLLKMEDDGGTRRSTVLLNNLLLVLDMGGVVGDVVRMRGR